MKNDCCRTAHLVGVCGSGMRALAEVLLDEGWTLSGSDLATPNLAIQRLMQRGFDFHQGHFESNLGHETQCLIYSPAIPADNVERRVATHRKLIQLSYSQMVGQLMHRSTGVCIAGTHGKSTTTAMTASILKDAGRLAAVVLGAELCESGRSGWSGSGDLFVAESCEFQSSFLDFEPKYTAILSVEPDHFDCYPDLESLKKAFCEFADKTARDGVLLFNADCPVSREVCLLAESQTRRVSFGFSAAADWRAVKIEGTATGTRFQLTHHNIAVADIELTLYGTHNVMNGLAAASLGAEIGVAPDVIRSSLIQFQGIRRRLEFVGDWHGVTFVDDYAHHPTAVKVTLKTLRAVIGTRKLWCVFQPHQILRTTALMSDFACSFVDADEVLIAPVFAARESVTDEPQRVSQELANRISSAGVIARFFPSLDQIVNTLEDAARPGDVIVTMGAGDIDRIHHEFTRRIH